MAAETVMHNVSSLPPYRAPPPQVAARGVNVGVGGARLAAWDTGGPGVPLVLLHPATGSAGMWLYQQPVFAAAGYRVVGYSRRGHAGSDAIDLADPGSAAEDLRALLDALEIGAAHLVASAGGGAVALDFALAFPDRVATLVLSSSVGGLADPDYAALSASLRPPGFEAMPPTFRELGPSYRAASPEGVAPWLALEQGAVTGRHRGQRAGTVTLAALGTLQAPVLLMTGAADLWQPPAMLRFFAQHLPHNEVVVVPEAGHALYWETPDVFNDAVLDFLARHGG